MTRSIGKVTTASATGAGVGAAIAAIIVWALNLAGVDAGAIEAAISVVLTAGIALLGGYLVPPTPEPDEADDAGDFSMEQIDEITTVTKYRPSSGDRGNQDDPDSFDDVIRPRD